MPPLNQKYPIRTEWSEEDECFVATCAQFPGLTGADVDEAIAVAELREAIDMALEVMHEDGVNPPEPETASAFSGQFRLRLPKKLHAALANLASSEGVSLNSLATTYIAMGVGGGQSESKVGLQLLAMRADLLAERQGTPVGAEFTLTNNGGSQDLEIFGRTTSKGMH